METLRRSDITLGDCYGQSIFLPAGQKLIPPDTPIGRRHLDLLDKHGYLTVYLADRADEVHDAARRRDRFAAPPADADPSAKPHGPAAATDHAALTKRRLKRVDERIEQLRTNARHIDRTVRPDEREIWDSPPAVAVPWPSPDQLQADRRALVQDLRDIFHRVDAGVTVAFDELTAVVDQLYPLLHNHRRRFTQLALLVPRRDDYLADHAACVAVLAMAAAAQLTWQPHDIRTVGLAALVADLGMLMVPRRILAGGQQLSDIDRGRVRQHPAYTLVMLDTVRDAPLHVRLAAYQHHERDNGSGYPHGLRSEAIHDVARVLAVADALAARLSPRNYRRNQLPYAAVEQIVRDAAANQFHKPAVRALVQAAGLFPVGSFVLLSNRKTAQVVAANPNHLDRPVVQPVDDQGRPVDPPIDLALLPAHALAVTNPIPAPGRTAPTLQPA